MSSTRAKLLKKNLPREGERVISTLKPYPAYKDSGVEWLGQVPEHWEVVPLKRLAWFKSGAGFPVQHQGDRSAEIPFFKVSDMNTPGNEKYLRVCANTVSMTVAQRLGATVFPAGTIVFPKVGGALLTNKRRIAANQCCIDNNMMGCVARNGNRDFLFLVMSYIDLSEVAQPGPVPAISEGEVREIRVVLPPLPEQTVIVRFLNWAEQRIRRVIRARQRRIKLLEEYKQALIHQAVTGSIDVRTGKPYPAYKDSGVEWLGEVPEHWQVRKLKYVVSFTGGGTPSKTVAVYWEGDVPWVSPKDMTCPVLHDTTDHISWDAIEVSATSLVPAGTLLIVVRSGILRRKIPAAINAVPMALNQDMKALRPKERLAETTFLLAFIQGCEVTLLTEWTKHGATVESIEYELLANSRIPLPPLPEQTAIVEYLDTQTTKIDAAIAATRSEIELLREYRTRLIADVVTGKVDVREVAARLPEEVSEEEAESIDTDEIAEGEATDEEAGTETVEEEEVEP